MSENDGIAVCSSDCTSRERLLRSMRGSLIFLKNHGKAEDARRFLQIAAFLFDARE